MLIHRMEFLPVKLIKNERTSSVQFFTLVKLLFYLGPISEDNYFVWEAIIG